MADDTLRRPCQSGKNSYLFDLAGDNVKWKTISLTHVEYPEGNYSSCICSISRKCGSDFMPCNFK